VIKQVIGVLLSFCLLVVQAVADVSHRVIHFVPFEQARIIEQSQQERQSYIVALGAYEKRKNRWQPERSFRVAGALYKQTHEIPSGYDEKDIFDFYKGQLPEVATTLYECERRNCGESNNWANDHFGIKRLYGNDGFQFYGVYQLKPETYVTIYSVRRGNRRIYAQLEVLVGK